MRSGVLEKVRLLEADLEACRASVVNQLLVTSSNTRYHVLRDHFVVKQAQVALSLREKLLDIYLDEDDIEVARNEPTDEESVAEALRDFDGRIAEVREYHKRYPDANPLVRKLATPDPAMLDNIFSVPECYGEVLDLQTLHEAYRKFAIESRLKPGMEDRCPLPCDFPKFVETLPTLLLTGVPLIQKCTAIAPYRSFVESTHAYLVGFYRRIKPLDPDPLQKDLDTARTGYQEFVAVMEKHQLAPQHMKRFEKQYAAWPKTTIAEFSVTPENANEIAVLEAQVTQMLMSCLAAVYDTTTKRTLRTGSKTLEEVEREAKEADDQFWKAVRDAQAHVDSVSALDHIARAELSQDVAALPADVQVLNDSDDDDEGNNNAETEFIGADGKPLQTYLITLMQLKKKFPCEICGGEVYRGLKMYREHFILERHTEGLRHLAVPFELVHYFVGISTIDDTLKFRDLLRQRLNSMNLRKRIREDADDEQNQDIQGNVMTAKAFSQFQGRRHTLTFSKITSSEYRREGFERMVTKRPREADPKAREPTPSSSSSAAPDSDDESAIATRRTTANANRRQSDGRSANSMHSQDDSSADAKAQRLHLNRYGSRSLLRTIEKLQNSWTAIDILPFDEEVRATGRVTRRQAALQAAQRAAEGGANDPPSSTTSPRHPQRRQKQPTHERPEAAQVQPQSSVISEVSQQSASIDASPVTAPESAFAANLSSKNAPASFAAAQDAPRPKKPSARQKPSELHVDHVFFERLRFIPLISRCAPVATENDIIASSSFCHRSHLELFTEMLLFAAPESVLQAAKCPDVPKFMNLSPKPQT